MKERVGVELDVEGYRALFLKVAEAFEKGRFDGAGNDLWARRWKE